MSATDDLTAEALDPSAISWSRPTNLREAWVYAPQVRRRWLIAAASLFSVGLALWLASGFVPAGGLPHGEWLTVAGFLPLAGVVAFGIALSYFMAKPVAHPNEDAVVGFVRELVRRVRELTKVDLDYLAADLAGFRSTASIESDNSTTVVEVIHDFDAESAVTAAALLSALERSDEAWQPRLREALATIVGEEIAGVSHPSRAQRLVTATPSDRRHARWRPAVMIFAMLTVFANIIGLIALALLGLNSEFTTTSGLTIGPAMGLLVGWIGLQLTTLPDRTREERTRAVAETLGATREQSS